jgi:hypothetical protein
MFRSDLELRFIDIAAVALLAGILMWPAAVLSAVSDADADSTLSLRGDEEGTALRSLTIEAENKVQITFERPELFVDLDPSAAPGLDWGTAEDVLNRTVPDLVSPLIASTSDQQSRYMPRPWLSGFTSGPVARFQPQLEGVHRWRLAVANSQGQPVVDFEGKGKPPKEIAWDGRSSSGDPAMPGLTYSYVLEAFDKAGNKRNFVGNGFELPPYRVMGENSIAILFSGDDLDDWGSGRNASRQPTHPLILEAASWLNQIEDVQQPVTVTVTARSFDAADALATRIAEALRTSILSGKSRILAHTEVKPEAPASGAIQIASNP